MNSTDPFIGLSTRAQSCIYRFLGADATREMVVRSLREEVFHPRNPRAHALGKKTHNELLAWAGLDKGIDTEYRCVINPKAVEHFAHNVDLRYRPGKPPKKRRVRVNLVVETVGAVTYCRFEP